MNTAIYECHCHIALDGTDVKSAVCRHASGPDREYIRNVLSDYRDNGIFYIRDGGDKWGVSKAAKQIAGEYDIEYATPIFPIYKKGYYGSFIGMPYETITEYRELVSQAKREGADFIKLMGSGIMDFSRNGMLTGQHLTLHELREMVSIAHGEGFPVMIHMNSADGVKAAVEAGVDSVEHGNYVDRSALAMLAESDCIWVPTLMPTENLIGQGLYDDESLKSVLGMQLGNVALGHAFHVTLAAGSDAGCKGVHHVQGALEEAERMAKLLGSFSPILYGQEKLRERFKGR